MVRPTESARSIPPFRPPLPPVTLRYMDVPQPYSGHFDGNRHLFAVRVYFEDTDFSGVVYHARYLHFMERARSDMLACVGINQRGAHAGGEGVYAVAELAIKYRAPAHFDDALLVVSQMEAVRGASVVIHQRVMRGQEIITDARVTAAFLSPNGRPRRQPKPWVAAFTAVLDSQFSQSPQSPSQG
jgi:acyl-CoA thioester hydrolase